MQAPEPVDIIIYHNPECGTSRNALAMIRNAGIEPHVIEYLKTPPGRPLLVQLMQRAGLKPRDLIREKGTPFHELGLGDPSLTDDALIDAIESAAVPPFANVTFVVTLEPTATLPKPSGDGESEAEGVPVTVMFCVIAVGFE